MNDNNVSITLWYAQTNKLWFIDKSMEDDTSVWLVPTFCFFGRYESDIKKKWILGPTENSARCRKVEKSF